MEDRTPTTQTVIDRLQAREGYAEQIVHIEHMPHSSAAFGSTRTPINRLLRHALEIHGIDRLYSHQAEAIDALTEGHNIVVATTTASGKSLCYNVPILHSYMESGASPRGATALYLFPTKALAQDQLRALKDLTRPLPKPPVTATYDGDTPYQKRAAIRKSVQLLLTNPDMVHTGILPNHRLWARFLRNLRFIVIDEGHVYRGVFGSHVALLIRRLLRLCRKYGSAPQLIVTTATLGNPKEHAEALTGLDVLAITEDGAPSAGREFVIWNPPVIEDGRNPPTTKNSARLRRRGTIGEGTELFAQLVHWGKRTLAFVRSRSAAELMYRYAEERIGIAHDDRAVAAGSHSETDTVVAAGVPGRGRSPVSSYRAGYMPEERREIEVKLASGELTGVVTTNALELGIDIGHLDVTLLNGYPGSLSATFQQAGRSGRRTDRGLSIMVLNDNPLDQYLGKHPDILFRRGMEHARISTTNPRILDPHVICAAFEAPLGSIPGDIDMFGGDDVASEALERLAEAGLLTRRLHGDSVLWHLHPKAGGHPAGDINLRATSGARYTLVNEATGLILEEVDEPHAFMNAHPHAVYLHRGEEFEVTAMNSEEQRIMLKRVPSPFYTVSTAHTELSITGERQHTEGRGARIALGEVEITRTMNEMTRLRHYSNEEYRNPTDANHPPREPIDLPPRSFNTVALWWTVQSDMIDALTCQGVSVVGALHALEHACISLLPLFALCDRADIGGISTDHHPDTGEATIFIYDGSPGGVGIAERGYEVIRDLWEATLAMLGECPCTEGCPSCVQSPKCGNNNEPLDKRGARLLVQGILDDNPRP